MTLAQPSDLLDCRVRVPVQRFLEAAVEYVRELCQREWDLTGPQTADYFDLGPGDGFSLPDEYPSDLILVGFDLPEGQGVTLTPAALSLHAHGHVQLTCRLSPIDNYGWMVRYNRIEASWTASGIVPAPVREAVACIAAVSQLRGPRDTSGVSSERIEGYSYATVGGVGLTLPERALVLLAPHMSDGACWPGRPELRPARGQLVW